MDSEKFFLLLRKIAESGLRHWRDASPDLPRRLPTFLSTKLISNSEELDHILNKNSFPSEDSTDYKLIPLYLHDDDSAFFLLPLWEKRHSPDFTARLHLVIVKKDPAAYTVAFRFEPPDLRGDRHTYWHVQLTSRIGHRQFALPKSPEWLPQSYPALPLPALEGFSDLLICSFVACAGYPEKVRDIFKKRLQLGVRDQANYVRRIDALFQAAS